MAQAGPSNRLLISFLLILAAGAGRNFDRAGAETARRSHFAFLVTLDGRLNLFAARQDRPVRGMLRPRVDRLHRNVVRVRITYGQMNRIAAVVIDVGAGAERD